MTGLQHLLVAVGLQLVNFILILIMKKLMNLMNGLVTNFCRTAIFQFSFFFEIKVTNSGILELNIRGHFTKLPLFYQRE